MAGWPRCPARSTAWIRSAFAVMPRRRARLRAALICAVVSLAAGAGVPSGFGTIKPPEFFLFEPHQPELCNFMPTTFVDITPVLDAKVAAMSEMKAQAYLQTYYRERADHRGNHARRASGNSEIRQAEAFMRVIPQVVSAL